MRTSRFGVFVTLILLSVIARGFEPRVFLSPEDFIRQHLGEQAESGRLWLKKGLQQQIRAILDHPYPAARLKYWKNGPRTAWILEEIGKERPITVGIVVNDGAIEAMEVLIYRESRGGEVRHESFRRQFEQARLNDQQQLDKPVDSISGATLSSRALVKLARLALLLHAQVQ